MITTVYSYTVTIWLIHFSLCVLHPSQISGPWSMWSCPVCDFNAFGSWPYLRVTGSRQENSSCLYTNADWFQFCAFKICCVALASCQSCEVVRNAFTGLYGVHLPASLFWRWRARCWFWSLSFARTLSFVYRTFVKFMRIWIHQGSFYGWEQFHNRHTASNPCCQYAQRIPEISSKLFMPNKNSMCLMTGRRLRPLRFLAFSTCIFAVVWPLAGPLAFIRTTSEVDTPPMPSMHFVSSLRPHFSLLHLSPTDLSAF